MPIQWEYFSGKTLQRGCYLSLWQEWHLFEISWKGDDYAVECFFIIIIINITTLVSYHSLASNNTASSIAFRYSKSTLEHSS
jgi:hypothetical protein